MLTTKAIARLNLARATATQWSIAIGLFLLLILPALRNLSFNVWFGSLATGLCFAFVALGVLISFRVLDFPDLTIDGSFPLGAALAAVLISNGVNPLFTLPAAFVGGALAGIATAAIATRLRIHSLLASILVTTALISINLRIMGRSNIPLLNAETIFSPLAKPFRDWLAGWDNPTLLRLSSSLLVILLVGLLVWAVKASFDWLMRTEVGLAMRATGDNSQMIRALGVNTNRLILLGLALSNGLVGLSGAIFAQYQGFADVNMGMGLIIAGLAAVIIGETLLRPQRIARATTAVIIGMVLYRMAIAAALNIQLPLPGGGALRIEAQDVKLATAVLVLLALSLSHKQQQKRKRS